MARRWNLPSALVDAISNLHHRRLPRRALLASAVHVADAAMMMLGIGIGKDGLQYELDPVACQRLAGLMQPERTPR
jgi:HD-like signal output (HDOD) protein